MKESTLFPKPVPITVVTGEYKSGKTIFALTTGYPLARVLLYDNELGAETYHTADNPFVRVDIPSQMKDGYADLEFYDAWINHMRSISAGEYDVIIVDTIEPIEAGLTEWVRRNPRAFNRTAWPGSTVPGVFWAAVKSQWKKIIQEMKSKCEMVILVVHMRDEYQDQVRTGRRERRGKETLSELATVEIEMVRRPIKVNGRMQLQAIPSAIVHKDRFFSGTLTDPSSIKPILPTWLEECTWDVIRGYMQSPVKEDIQPPSDLDTRDREMEMKILDARISENRALEAEAKAAVVPRRPPPQASPKILFWDALKPILISRGVSTEGNIEESLKAINEPWAKEVLGCMEEKNWDKAMRALPDRE